MSKRKSMAVNDNLRPITRAKLRRTYKRLASWEKVAQEFGLPSRATAWNMAHEKQPVPTYKANSALTAAVLDVLETRVGQENAIGRESLLGWLRSGYRGYGEPDSPVCHAISDRQMRDAIADLRLQGHLIANLGTGYFITSTRAEIESFLAQERSRARQVEAGLRALERAAEAKFAEWEQMEMGLFNVQKGGHDGYIWIE